MTAKWDNFVYNGGREELLGLLDGGDKSEYTGAGFVEISDISAINGAVLFAKDSFDRV